MFFTKISMRSHGFYPKTSMKKTCKMYTCILFTNILYIKYILFTCNLKMNTCKIHVKSMFSFEIQFPIKVDIDTKKFTKLNIIARCD